MPTATANWSAPVALAENWGTPKIKTVNSDYSSQIHRDLKMQRLYSHFLYRCIDVHDYA